MNHGYGTGVAGLTEVSASYAKKKGWNAACSFAKRNGILSVWRLENESFEVISRAGSIGSCYDCAAGLCPEHRRQPPEFRSQQQQFASELGNQRSARPEQSAFCDAVESLIECLIVFDERVDGFADVQW